MPGRTLVVDVDMDAKKSIHVVQTGNGDYRLRPVVFVEFSNTEAPVWFGRIEGLITEVVDSCGGPLCVLLLGRCRYLPGRQPHGRRLRVRCGWYSIDPIALAVSDAVVVIGCYSGMGGDLVLDAIVVEQGPVKQVTGIVNTLPDATVMFLLIDREVTSLMLGDCTQVFVLTGRLSVPLVCRSARASRWRASRSRRIQTAISAALRSAGYA